MQITNLFLLTLGTLAETAMGAVFSNCTFGDAIKRNILNISGPKEMNTTNIKFPYVFVGDDAFP